VVSDKVIEHGVIANVRHISYADDEARGIAARVGLVPGTAKDVAKRLNHPIDLEEINRVIQHPSIDGEYKAYNDCGWSPELDELLRYYEHRAKDVGVLMTPVLLVNGEIKHQGSVPGLSQLDEWIISLRE
jgi:hypothetical protein